MVVNFKIIFNKERHYTYFGVTKFDLKFTELKALPFFELFI